MRTFGRRDIGSGKDMKGRERGRHEEQEKDGEKDRKADVEEDTKPKGRKTRDRR